MKIIVDTNIIFSALLKSESPFGDLILNSSDVFEFFSMNYLTLEIEKHWDRILRISNLSSEEIQTSKSKLFAKIQFITDGSIRKEIWLWAENLVQDIDQDDVDFVALTKFLEGNLWSGDKVLILGLRKKGFQNIITTSELFALRDTIRNGLTI